MANAPSAGSWDRRSTFNLYELVQSWWRHRVSFLVSVGITLAALALYYFTFLGERPTPIFAFLQRLEFNSLDTRFRYRPATASPIGQSPIRAMAMASTATCWASCTVSPSATFGLTSR